MQKEATAAMVARIQERLEALDMTERDASIAATGSPFAIRNMKRGSMPAVDLFEKLAPVLETTPGYLAYGDGKASAPQLAPARPSWPPIYAMPIIGEVAAGQWMTVDQEVDAPLYDDLAIPPDPSYPPDWQFACVVRGTSINRVAPDGAVLACLDLRKSGTRPRQHELVIVEQRRSAGQEVMRTAKRYVETEDTVELRPDSNDPRWKTPIVLDPADPEEGVEVVLIGKVTWVYAPIDRLDRAADRERSQATPKRRG